MKKISLFLICFLIVIDSFSQKQVDSDSTLFKFVKAISLEIQRRAMHKRTAVSPASITKYVFIGKEPVLIDSLYKFNIKEFKSITINFDFSTAIYGVLGELGIITLQKKEDSKEDSLDIKTK